jgi:hypothetical protein
MIITTKLATSIPTPMDQMFTEARKRLKLEHESAIGKIKKDLEDAKTKALNNIYRSQR